MSVNKTSFPHSKPRVWLIIIVFLVAVALAAIVPLLLIHVYQQSPGGVNAAVGTGPQSFAVGTNASIAIREQSGNVSVYASNTNTITVTPRTHGTLVAPDLHTVRILYTHTHTMQGNDQLTITTDPWLSNTDFYVTVPVTTFVQITLNAGSIDAHTGHGLTASTGSGIVEFDTIQGNVNVHTDSGDVTGNSVTGTVIISASSGSIRLQKVRGRVDAQTWSGDIIVSALSIDGKSRLQTQNGSVRFAGSIDPRGSYTMQTTNGDVDLTLPANSAFTLDASTGSGTIQNAFSTMVAGATPRAQLSLHTQNGSIVVVKAS